MEGSGAEFVNLLLHLLRIDGKKVGSVHRKGGGGRIREDRGRTGKQGVGLRVKK